MGKRGSRDKINEDSLRDILLAVLPRLFAYLYQRSGAVSAGDFGAKAGDLNPSTVSNYRNGKNLPLENLPDIATRTGGLSTGNLGWFLGKLLIEHYEEFEFALPDQAGEIREPKARFDLRLPHEEIEDVKNRDLRGLEPEDVRTLNLDREAIDAFVENKRDSLKVLRKLLAAWEEKYSVARRRAAGTLDPPSAAEPPARRPRRL